MEVRESNLRIESARGNASRNAKKYRIDLPSKWVKEMGFSLEDRKASLVFDGDTILIKKGDLARDNVRSETEP